ncbi:MAG: mechanosensitive ion channel family protein [Dehalococcoidia bacterium]|nr:mechanosensitive ion channel family protein [Dehalococcoidia bacterium]
MPQEIAFVNVMYALIIVFVGCLAAFFYNWRLLIILKRLADKTSTSLDNFLIKSLKWPVFVVIILVSIYLASLCLPLADPLGSAVKKGFYIAFLALAGWVITMLLDSIYCWYKLEVASKTHTALDDWMVGVLRIFTPLVVLALVLIFSLTLLDVDTTAVTGWLEEHGSRIGLVLLLTVALIFITARALPAVIRGVVFQRAFGQPDAENVKRADTLSTFFVTSGQVLFLAVAAFMILSELGVDIGPILASVGIAGIAIGFGAQTLVKDHLAGIFIILENQYRVGDVVKVADITGLVEQIDLRRTILRDLDGVQHIISNGEIRQASNYTKEMSRINLNISVSYGTDLDFAIDVMNRVCREMAEEPDWAPAMIKTPQVLRVDNLGDSGIDIKILGEVQPGKQWDVTGEIRKRIKRTFDDEGIEIPWPHTKIFFGNSPWKNESQSPISEAGNIKPGGHSSAMPDRGPVRLPPDSADDD